MRSRLGAAIGLTLALCGGGGCVLVWSYGSFHDQPDAGGSGGSDGGAEGTGGGTKANSEPCTLGSECVSGHCTLQGQADAGSICCAGACGACEVCATDGGTADGGACETVPVGARGPGCPGSMLCDGLGHCAVPNGGACPVDAGACLSGTCVGAICCATPCTTCQTCAAEGSMCVAATAGTMDPACPTGTACDGAGNCVAPGPGG
jgi:hypothetical protein